MTKKQLIRYLKKNNACEPALIWLNKQETFGPELIRKCPTVEWLEWLAHRVNPTEYDAKEKSLWDEYKAKVKPLWDEHESKMKPLWDEYVAKRKPLWDEYDAKAKPLQDEYEAKLKPLWDEYKAKKRVVLRDILTWDKIEKAVAASDING